MWPSLLICPNIVINNIERQVYTMIVSPSECVSDYLLLPESYTKMDVIDCCYVAINEDTATPRVIDMATSYTYGLVLEILESVKNQLMSLQATILSYFNNYILNTANMADKYRDAIVDRVKTLKTPIVYRTYGYQKLFDKSYPPVIKAQSSEITNAIEDFQNRLIDEDLSSGQQSDIVDGMIENFGYSVIGAAIDPNNLKDSVVKTTRDILRGREQVRALDAKSVSKFIDEIATYRPTKDALARTKKAILDDYATLKSVYMAAMKKKESASVGIESIRDPEFVRFNKAESERFATINMNLTRLFNGYIIIYREVFNTEMEVLREKIDSNRAIIIKLLTETGVLAAINSRNPSTQRRPLVFDPKLKQPKHSVNG